jgi:riboflavin kinase/FMN adenylyltransferase
VNVLSPGWKAPPPSGVAIGVFDGVHRGHVTVIEGLVHHSRSAGLSVGVLTFDPHPVEVLAPSRAPLLLTSVERRVGLLREIGVDWVGILDLRDIRTMTPQRFVSEVVVDRASARVVSVGGDFRFGHDRAGNVDTLRELGDSHGFDVEVVNLVSDEEGVVSSTRIRRLVMEGEVAEAATLLGRPYRLGGEVVKGDARGRGLGFPTANIVPPPARAVPADGIYAVRVWGAISADGVASLGVRPTFGTSGARLLEVHVFDHEGDLYGADLEVDFIQRLRGEERFDSVEELVTQMEKDAADARRALAG